MLKGVYGKCKLRDGDRRQWTEKNKHVSLRRLRLKEGL